MKFPELVERLERKGWLMRIQSPVDPKLEAAKIARQHPNQAVLLERVKGSSIPAVLNVFFSRAVLAEALNTSMLGLKHKILRAIQEPKPVKLSRVPEYERLDADLRKLPILQHYSSDAGKYITAGVVVAHHPKLGVNLSYHRMLVVGNDRLVLRILPRHLNEFIRRGVRQFVIAIGNQPQIALAGAISVELGQSELEIANALKPVRVFELWNQPVPEAEILLLAELTGKTREEGPFVDITGTLDIVRSQPEVRIKEILAKPGALYHSILPAGPEHRLLMGMPKEPVIMQEVNKVCECLDVHITPGGCSWLHAVVKIRKRHPDDGKRAILAAFRAHRSLKHVWVVDEDIDIYNAEEVEWAMATRFQGSRDLIIKREAGSSLDPSANQRTRVTTKLGFDLTVPDLSKKSKFVRAE